MLFMFKNYLFEKNFPFESATIHNVKYFLETNHNQHFAKHQY